MDNRARRSTRVEKYRQSLSSENIGQVSGCAMASYSSGMRRHRTGTAMAPRVRSATPSPTGCHFGAPAQAGIEHNVLHQGEAVGAQAAFSACGAGRRPRPIIQEDDRGHHSPSTSQQPRIAFQCLIGSRSEVLHGEREPNRWNRQRGGWRCDPPASQRHRTAILLALLRGGQGISAHVRRRLQKARVRRPDEVSK